MDCRLFVKQDQFVLASETIQRILHLPTSSVVRLLLVFSLSGVIYGRGCIMALPTPYPPDIMILFFLSGPGAACEVAFKRITGNKAYGRWGRLWLWKFLLVAGRPTCWAWCDSGLTTTALVPRVPGVDWGIGPLMVRLCRALVVDGVPKEGERR